MNRTQRTLSRIAGLALVLTGASLFTAGQASANDRAVVVSCTDQSAGTWTVSVTFSGIEVRADRPVEVSLGSDSATLTEPGANGTATLQQNFGAGQTAANLTWSVVRLDYQNMGVLNLDRPVECTVTPTTEAPPITEAPPVTEAAKVLGVQATPAAQPVSRALPETGRPALPLVALGAVAVIGGLGLVGVARRRPEESDAA